MKALKFIAFVLLVMAAIVSGHTIAGLSLVVMFVLIKIGKLALNAALVIGGIYLIISGTAFDIVTKFLALL